RAAGVTCRGKPKSGGTTGRCAPGQTDPPTRSLHRRVFAVVRGPPRIRLTASTAVRIRLGRYPLREESRRPSLDRWLLNALEPDRLPDAIASMMDAEADGNAAVTRRHGDAIYSLTSLKSRRPLPGRSYPWAARCPRLGGRSWTIETNP